MKKIVTILGARPQFVKAAVLSRIIREQGGIEEVIVHTGQHFDQNMSTVFFEEMTIPEPAYNLNINSLSHGAMTGQMMEKIEAVLIKEKPRAVVVYGDTNSTIAGALAARKLHIKVIHVEAGLRSFIMEMPEEVNRILTDRISDLLLCPTDIAVQNLMNEGFDGFSSNIEKPGDIMKDAVKFYSRQAAKRSSIIKDLSLEDSGFVLATVHRQENTDNPLKLKAVFSALEKIHASKKIVLPLHPGTKKALEDIGLTPAIQCIDPVGYFDMLQLLAYCDMVITDSGGLQKEAFFHKKHCIVLREETEWKELVSNGFAKITGTDQKRITTAYQYFLHKNTDFEVDLYGSNVGEKIYRSILDLLNN